MVTYRVTDYVLTENYYIVSLPNYGTHDHTSLVLDETTPNSVLSETVFRRILYLYIPQENHKI